MIKPRESTMGGIVLRFRTTILQGTRQRRIVKSVEALRAGRSR
jgi:hypothetical protein